MAVSRKEPTLGGAVLRAAITACLAIALGVALVACGQPTAPVSVLFSNSSGGVAASPASVAPSPTPACGDLVGRPVSDAIEVAPASLAARCAAAVTVFRCEPVERTGALVYV
jgi:hypothetical protein